MRTETVSEFERELISLLDRSSTQLASSAEPPCGPGASTLRVRHRNLEINLRISR